MSTDDEVSLYVMYRELTTKVDSYSGRVREGRDVMAAKELANCLYASGIHKFFKANSQPEPFKVDGALFLWKVEELIRLCNDRFRTGSKTYQAEASEVQSLHEKIDLMAGYLSRLTTAPAVAVMPLAEPQLSIVRNVGEEGT